MTGLPDKLSNRWQVLLILVTFSILICLSGLFFYLKQIKKVTGEKEQELNAIISLKVRDITEWRKEHLRDAILLGGNSVLADIITNFLSRGEEKGLEELSLRSIFDPISEDYDYQIIFISDTNNIIRFSNSPKSESTGTMRYIPDKSGIPDLQFSGDSSMIFMDIPVSIMDSKGVPAGTLVLRIDPAIKLFPNIQTWPVQSKTSETLLLRRDGDSVLYLNELRHLGNTALKLKRSASDSSLPAAMALKGYEGFFKGRDYRGEEVFSYIRKIPDSPWFIIAKTDKAEVFAPLSEQFYLILLNVMLIIAAFSVIIVLYFRNQRIKNLRELNATRDKLYSIITHDLKNPFVSIMGFSELLYERSKKNDLSRTAEFASIIYSSSRNAMDLLNNLTSWTKLQVGKTFFNPQEIKLSEIIREVVESCQSAAIMKSISISVDIPAEIKIMADKEMVSTILRNLVYNAIKFSLKDSPITISGSRNEDFAELEVSDTGVGMDKKTVEKLSGSGEINSTPGTSNEKGTGLGLYICREFISFHKGQLLINSEPGKGSKFIVRLPYLAK